MKEFKTAVTEHEQMHGAEGEKTEERYVEFKIDDRTMKAYHPNDAQTTLMLATLGRGQSPAARFATILNVMFEALDEPDKDYLEERMMTRDPKRRIPMSTIESIFEYLTEEWFGHPTQSPSDSPGSQEPDGSN